MPRFDDFSWLSAGYLARRLCDRVNFWNFCSYPVPAPANSNATVPQKDCFKLPFLPLSLFIYFYFFMYIIWTLFTKDNKKRIPLKNVAKTTCQPPYCCLILNLRIEQENCIEEIQMTNEGGYIICSKALIWTQISFRRSKNYFKTTLKKAQRVIKTWQMTLIVNIYTLQLSL